jgi:hypothetical protein
MFSTWFSASGEIMDGTGNKAVSGLDRKGTVAAKLPGRLAAGAEAA